MSKRSWQSHYFSLTASSTDGKDTASPRHHLYKYNDGATWWELQRLIMGYLNDRRDRAWENKQAHLGSLLSGVGLGHANNGGEVARHGQGDESR